MTPDEKQEFANEAEKALDHPLVQEVIEELFFNLNINNAGLPRMGIMKVGMYVATVARAHALGIDPDELRMTDEESDDFQLSLIQAMIGAGKPVVVITTGETHEPSS
jgi:hypothetical protein